MFRLWQFLRVKNVQIVLREFLLVVEGGLFLCVGVFKRLAESSQRICSAQFG